MLEKLEKLNEFRCGYQLLRFPAWEMGRIPPRMVSLSLGVLTFVGDDMDAVLDEALAFTATKETTLICHKCKHTETVAVDHLLNVASLVLCPTCNVGMLRKLDEGPAEVPDAALSQ